MSQIFDFIGGGVLPIFFIIVVVVLIVSYIGRRYKVAGANEALIVSATANKATGPTSEASRLTVRPASSCVRNVASRAGDAMTMSRSVSRILATRSTVFVALAAGSTVKTWSYLFLK